MCTRFFVDADNEDMSPYVSKAKASSLMTKYEEMGKKTMLSGEMFPTDVAAAIAPDKSGNPSVFPMIWGFSSFDGKPIVNARLETAFEKPMFRDSWKNRRCVIPVSYYFEWEHVETPSGRKTTGPKNKIWLEGSSVTFLCGLYSIKDNLPYFAIVTRTPGEMLRRIHDRMPLVLPKEKAMDWLKTDDPNSLVKDSLTELSAIRTEM